jgi:lysophospholipase L1-like esterase
MIRYSPKLRIAPAALILAFWAGTTGCDTLGLGDDDSPTAPSPPADGSAISYAALGASDVTGIGSSAPCLVPFADCPASKGYVFVAAGSLRTQGHRVTVTNLGMPTATISRAFQNLGQQYGHEVLFNIIDSQVPFVRTDTTVVTVFAGGNDLNVITAALGGGAGGSNPNAFVDQQVQTFANDYAALLSGIRGRASAARVIALNMPNLAGMPYLATAPAAHRQAAQRASVGMTKTAINPLTSQGVRVVDLMCLSPLYDRSSLSSDGFHPSDAGYALMAAEVVRAATASTYPLPQVSCPQMTLVP